MTDAIRTNEDAPAEVPAGAKTVAQSRLDKLEQVSNNYLDELEKETGIDFRGDKKPPEEAAQDQAPAAKAVVANEDGDEPPLTTAELGGKGDGDEDVFDLLDGDREARTRVRVKIDGVEQDIPLSEVKRGYQKDSAASKRLEEAARRQRELDEREATLAAREAALTSSGGAADVPLEEQPRTPEERAAAKKAFLDAIYAGDEEAADAALDNLLEGRSPTTQNQQVDVAAVTEQVKTQVKMQLTVDEAMGKFATDFNDVVADPHLSRVADSYLAEIQSSEPGLPLSEALRKAGNKTRAWVRSRAGVTGEPSADQRSDKQSRKESIDTPEAAGAVATGGEQDVAPETATDTISAMAAARGLTRQTLR